ncbi:MAG: hypothetical protein WED09_12955 [Homoserinimonas sp.]
MEQLEAPRSIVAELRTWQPRRWWFAAGTAAVTIVFVAIPTVLIPNPWFVREMPVTPWAWPVLLVTSVLAGLVAATYVARKDAAEKDRGGPLGATGAIVTFFAVGCPVCNKLVLIALGYTGALQFFEPLQPYLAGGSVVLLAVALAMRIRRERSCPLSRPKAPSSAAEAEPQEQSI